MVTRRSLETVRVVSVGHFEEWVKIVKGSGGGGYRIVAEALDEGGTSLRALMLSTCMDWMGIWTRLIQG